MNTMSTVTANLTPTVPPTVSANVPPTVTLTVPPTVTLTVPPTVTLTVPPTVTLTVPPTVTGPRLEQIVWKIIVVGDMNTGKTSIIERYCDQHFLEYCHPTAGIDLKKKTINFENKSVVLNIWDTAGTEKYQSLIQLYYRGAMGLFVVYDITNLNSLHNLDTWMKNIEDFAPPDVIRILIGNKSDMESQRKVSTEEGKMVAEHFGIPFFEVSSKSNINIDDCFSKMASMIDEMETLNTINRDFVILEDTQAICDCNAPSKCNC